jgi:hypothetical protein
MPNSIFNGNPMYLPPVQYNFEDYTAPALGVQASAGQTPYDRWLYAQNSRLGNLTLPSYTTSYAASNPNYTYGSMPTIPPVGVAPGSNGVYETNPWTPSTEPVTPPWAEPPSIPAPEPYPYPNPWTPPTEPTLPDNEGPPRLPPVVHPPYQPPQPTAPEPTYQPPEPTYQPQPTSYETVVGPVDHTPMSPEEIQRLAIRAQLQGLVASGDQEAALNYMNQNGITSGQFEEMLAYSGSPITSGSPYGWLANASQNTGIPVAGLSYASPEEVDQFISWQQDTPNSLNGQTGAEMTTAQGITDPYANATIRDNALQIIRTQRGLQSIRNANGNNWTPEYLSYTPQAAPQPSPLTQVQNSPNTVGPAPIVQETQQPQYQQVAGSFVNQDTGDIVTYDSNGAHTSTGRIDPSWLAAHQPPRTQTQSQPGYDFTYNDRARGGLISLSRKYAAGGLASKYGVR